MLIIWDIIAIHRLAHIQKPTWDAQELILVIKITNARGLIHYQHVEIALVL